MANTQLGRLLQLLLTNKSGGAVSYGDLVVLDSTTAESFTTTTTGSLKTDLFGIVLEPNGIANDAQGMVALAGPVPQVNLDSSASLGDYLFSDTVAGQATPSGTLAAGALGQVLETGTSPKAILWGGLPYQAATGASGLYASYAKLQEQQTSGTAGGGFTSGSYQTRVLNTEVHDADGIVTLSSNQFIPVAGTYRIQASGQAFQVNLNKLKLRNVTAGSDAVIGQTINANSADFSVVTAHLVGRFTANGTDAYELQHRCSTTKTGNGFGQAASFGDIEVYAIVELWKEA